MRTSDNGRKLIEQFEGLILQSYDDYNDHIVNEEDHVQGTLTIGYGHTSAAGAPSVFLGMRITKEEADQILATDLERVERIVTGLVKVSLNQNQFDALVSFEFNTGGLAKSTLLKFLNQGNYYGAADEFLKWTHASGRVLPGLIRRRQAERNLFLTKQTQTQGKQMNPFMSLITTLLGPTQIGGWVRAGTASGLTYLATKYGLSFLSDPGFISEIGAGVSTIIVGLWSSLGKTGMKTTFPEVLTSIEQQAQTPTQG